MTNEWMIDVLADLRAFAGSNGLVSLENELGTTMRTAIEEISAQTGVVAFWGPEKNDRPTEISGATPAFENAG